MSYSIAKHFSIYVVKSELDQMICGIAETLHALELIRHFLGLYLYILRRYILLMTYMIFFYLNCLLMVVIGVKGRGGHNALDKFLARHSRYVYCLIFY